MAWYGARNIYLFGVSPEGKNIFEERIVCIQASTKEEAHAKGIAESREYAFENGFEPHDEQVIYRQDGEALIDGYEVWSELYQSNKSLNEFYLEHCIKNVYQPESE